MLSKLRGLAGQRSNPRPLALPPLQYEKLLELGNIRLLQIAPGNGNQDINCTLLQTPLATATVYEALSYTWGSPGRNNTILCNGRATHVSLNLFQALRHIRQSSVEVIFWIDQLCINQADLNERSSQVALMGDIYARASRVVVWLGPEDTDSKVGIALARRILEVVGDRDHYHLIPGNLKSLSLPPYKDKSWRALGLFLQRPWFSRIWVIQEVVMSSSAVFVCGDEALTMAEFEKLVDRLMNLTTYRSFTGNYTSNSNGIWCLGVIHQLRKMRNSATSMKSIELLGMGMVSKASDPRDKIYALLSLGKFGIDADYSKPVEEVFTRYAIAYLSQILPSELTRQASRYMTDPIYSTFVAKLLVWVHSTDSNLKLPSWVPDWSRYPITTFMGASSPVTSPASVTLQVSAEQAQKYRCTEISILPKHSLRLSGKLCDEISVLGNKHIDLRKKQKPRVIYDDFADWYAETSVLVSHAKPTYPTGIPWQEAYIRTLTMESIGLGDSSASQAPSKIHLQLSHARIRQWNRGSSIDKFIAGDEKNEAIFWHEALKISGKCFFLTAKGYMGLAPSGTRIGDRIATLLGIKNPFIVHEVDGGYRLIGPCYVQGMMEGEAVLSGHVPFEPITLI
jgi:hypothetical protein